MVSKPAEELQIVHVNLHMKKRNYSNTYWIVRPLALTAKGELVQLPISTMSWDQLNLSTEKLHTKLLHELSYRDVRIQTRLFKNIKGVYRSVVHVLDKTNTLELLIQDPHRVLRLKAPTLQQKEIWVQSFCQCQRNLRNNQQNIIDTNNYDDGSVMIQSCVVPNQIYNNNNNNSYSTFNQPKNISNAQISFNFGILGIIIFNLLYYYLFYDANTTMNYIYTIPQFLHIIYSCIFFLIGYTDLLTIQAKFITLLTTAGLHYTLTNNNIEDVLRIFCIWYLYGYITSNFISIFRKDTLVSTDNYTTNNDNNNSSNNNNSVPSVCEFKNYKVSTVQPIQKKESISLPYPIYPNLTERQLYYVAIVERNLPTLIELCDYSYRTECWKSAGVVDGVEVQNYQLPQGEISVVSPSASLLSRGRKIVRYTPEKMMALLWQTETKPLYDMMVQYCKSMEIFNNHCKIERQLYKGFGLVSNRMLTLSAGWTRLIFDGNPNAPYSSSFYDIPPNLENSIKIRDATLLGVYDKSNTINKTKVRDEILNSRNKRHYMTLKPTDSFPTHTSQGYEYTRDGFAMVAVSVNWVPSSGIPEIHEKNIVVADLKIGGFFIRGVKLPKNVPQKPSRLNIFGGSSNTNSPGSINLNNNDEWIYGSEIVGIGAVNLCGKIPTWIVNEVSRRQASAVSQVQKFLETHASEIREEFLFA